MRVEVKTNNSQRILRQLIALERQQVTIGVHGDAGTRDGSAQTNAEIAAVHEFGDANIPERSFLRAGLDTAAETVPIDLAEQIEVMIEGGTMTPKKIATRGGVLILGAVRETIAAGIDPELSEQTKAARDAKGSNSTGIASNVGAYTPLVDTGQLWQSLVFRVSEANS
tara:strand:- start:5347 stop:5850 length:504 start_codon:yes stop_codon:yes gene_type:complete